MGKHLNPLEKEFLIRLYRGNPSIKLSEFCERNNISDGAFKKWLKQYEEGGLEGLARADKTSCAIPTRTLRSSSPRPTPGSSKNSAFI